MPTETRVSPRIPWMLPAVLAIIIVIVILAFIFAPWVKSALNSPTQTPITRTVVTTATPGGSATPGVPAADVAGALPSATPSTSQGVVTALPGSTPVPTVAGLQLDMITRPQHDVAAIQTAVDKGTAGYRFYLDPRLVLQYDLPHYGFTKGFEIVAPAPAPTPTPYSGPGKRPTVKFVVSYQGHVYTVFVTQTGIHGPKGIWLIVTILAGRQ